MDRPTAALEKMKDCLQHDSCGEWDCVYFANFKELQCVLAWVEELEEKNKKLTEKNKELSNEINEIYDNPGEWLAGL